VLRQLEIYGRDGLPVVPDDAQQVTGWVTRADVIGAVAREIRAAQQDVAQAQQAAEAVAAAENQSAIRRFAPTEMGDAAAPPPDPLPGHRIVEITLPDDSPAPARNSVTSPGRPVTCRSHCSATGICARPDRTLSCDRGTGIALLTPSPPEPSCALAP
jgi:hypothetical protein